MNPMQQVPLPDLDTIHARIKDLDEEAALLRKFLRVALRLKARHVKTRPTESVYLREVSTDGTR